MSRRLAVLLLLLATLVAAQAQSPVVQLRIQVFTQETRRPVADRVSVQLMDGFGTIESEQLTDDQGLVNFRTLPGYHRLRITSTEYDEYQGTFEIQLGSAHSEMVYLRRKPPIGGSPASPAGEKATIPAPRLRVPAAAEKEYNRGVAAMDKKNALAARRHFERAVVLYPDYDLAYNSLGILAIDRNDTEAARKAFETAIRINDHYAQAYRNLARILLAERKFAEVEDLLARSLTIEPMNAWALTQIAYAQLQNKKFTEAVQNARRAHALPHDGLANAHMIAAAALEALHQGLAAVVEYQLYLKEAPDGPYAKQARDSVARLEAAAQAP